MTGPTTMTTPSAVRGHTAQVRLFVAVDPPEAVVELLRAFERRPLPSLRWTSEAQWHVTLRFLGNVADDELGALSAALDTVPARLWVGACGIEAVLGPVSGWFPGRHVLQVPVGGLEELAAAVAEATGSWGEPAEQHFRGHLTLARVRGGHPGPPLLAGAALSGTWPVGELVLYSSVLGEGGPRYEAVHRVLLGA